MQQNHILPVLAVLVGLVTLTLVAPRVLKSALAVALDHSAPMSGEVYSVRALRGSPAHDQVAWLDRTIRVRAVADYCVAWVSLDGGDARNVCTTQQTVLRDATSTSSSEELPLTFAPEDRLLASLRHLRLIASLLQVAQVPMWGVPETYLVRLAKVPSSVCWNATPCIAAQLLDADQTALSQGMLTQSP